MLRNRQKRSCLSLRNVVVAFILIAAAWIFVAGSTIFNGNKEGSTTHHTPKPLYTPDPPPQKLKHAQQAKPVPPAVKERGEAGKKSSGLSAAERGANKKFEKSKELVEVGGRKVVGKLSYPDQGGLVVPTIDSMKKQRVFCMIPFIYKAGGIDKARYDSITKTYGKRCDIIRFMSDPYDGDYPDDVVTLSTLTRKPNDRTGPDQKPAKHIWEKVWRSWVHIADNYLDEAEWFTKIDHDTYFFPENVKHLVVSRNYSHEDVHYIGQKLYHRNILFNAGAAVTMSREALRLVSERYANMGTEESWERGLCIDHAGATEELSTAWCLSEVGVLAEDALDEENKDTIMTFYPSAHLNMIRDPDPKNQGWWWEHKPDWVRDGKECCSSLPIGIHNVKSVRDFYQFEEIFYGDKEINQQNFGHLAPDKVTVDYYHRARKAIRDISLPEPHPVVHTELIFG